MTRKKKTIALLALCLPLFSSSCGQVPENHEQASVAVKADASSPAPMPGEKPPPEVQAKLEVLKSKLETALESEDEEAVYAFVAQLREALGPYAGVPESPEKYAGPADTSLPDLERVLAETEAQVRVGLETHGCRSEDAQKNQMELRESAYITELCLALARVNPESREFYEARARDELEYLIPRQHPSGVFPYPANPKGSAPAHLREMAEELRREHPESVWNGYLIIDDSGNQFDTGCCAHAFIEGYKTFKDDRYLEVAGKSAEYVLAMDLGPNWNYNAFSVWQLAALYDVTREQRYLDGAVKKTVIGVLPGLMETGRWVDQHNAKQTYHFVMVRSLSELLHMLPQDHSRYEEIKEKTVLAAESRAAEILRDGPSNTESALWGLSAFLKALGPNEVCEKAANAIVKAMLAHGSPSPVATAMYLDYHASLGNI